MPPAGSERCDCGALVPVEDGPVHPYMRSAAACWRMFGALSADRYAAGWSSAASYSAPDIAGFSAVDCFATQHAGGAATDRRQRQSVAVHLVALCLRERGLEGRALATARQRTSELVLPLAGIADWPLLEPPADFGKVTAPAIWHAAGADRIALAAEWPAACWAAWSQHHATVELWADLLQAPR